VRSNEATVRQLHGRVHRRAQNVRTDWQARDWQNPLRVVLKARLGGPCCSLSKSSPAQVSLLLDHRSSSTPLEQEKQGSDSSPKASPARSLDLPLMVCMQTIARQWTTARRPHPCDLPWRNDSLATSRIESGNGQSAFQKCLALQPASK